MKIFKRIAHFGVFRGKRHFNCFPIYIVFLLTTFKDVCVQRKENQVFDIQSCLPLTRVASISLPFS